RRLDLLKAGDLEIRASFGLSYNSRDGAEQLAFRMLSLLAADFPAWNLAALLETDADEAEQLLEQLVDAVLVDIAGVDATGLIRYRLCGRQPWPGWRTSTSARRGWHRPSSTQARRSSPKGLRSSSSWTR